MRRQQTQAEGRRRKECPRNLHGAQRNRDLDSTGFSKGAAMRLYTKRELANFQRVSEKRDLPRSSVINRLKASSKVCESLFHTSSGPMAHFFRNLEMAAEELEFLIEPGENGGLLL